KFDISVDQLGTVYSVGYYYSDLLHFSLLSYNGLPLRRSTWSLSFSLRQLSGDGHVIQWRSQGYDGGRAHYGQEGEEGVYRQENSQNTMTVGRAQA
uniref:Uncharacterized protein n=1 Tax=Amphimedon queenslandica TaxID=400682 RepID=A0A1X7TCZ8_AMPQE